MDRIKISIPSYSRPTFEQVKSYEKCKNILRIIGLSKKKLKFEYDFECDSDKIGSVYIRFVPLLNSNKSAEEASEKKQMLFKRGSRFSNFIECYSPFSVGKFKVLLIIEIDDKIFNFELKTIKGHADNELEEKDHIKNFSHRKTIKNEFSLFLTESAKSTKRKLKEFEYETVEHAKRREKSESMNLFNAIPTAPTIIKKEKKDVEDINFIPIKKNNEILKTEDIKTEIPTAIPTEIQTEIPTAVVVEKGQKLRSDFFKSEIENELQKLRSEKNDWKDKYYDLLYQSDKPTRLPGLTEIFQNQ